VLLILEVAVLNVRASSMFTEDFVIQMQKVVQAKLILKHVEDVNKVIN